MSLSPRRRIFIRQKRRTDVVAVLRAGGLLVLGFFAAFGVTVVAVAWPGERAETGAPTVVYHLPAVRLAAASGAAKLHNAGGRSR